MTKLTKTTLLLLTALVLAVGLAACGGDDDETTGGENTAAQTNGDGGNADLTGNIEIDGSSTVAPLTSAAAEAFAGENPDVNITVGTSGTGGGFERFCTGETDISNASRGIADDEVEGCGSAGVEFEEFRVASDGITIVVGTDTDPGTDDLTIEQLAAVWSPDSEIDNWSQIPGGNFNDLPLTLAGPGSQSGTYDFFNEEVLGEDDEGETISPRQDYTASEDDNVIVRAVQSAQGAMGYFGYSYYEENTDTLRALSVEGVAPSPESITAGDYPLSRPLFIYVNTEALARPEVKAFVCYYLENSTSLAEEQAYVPAPQDALDESSEKAGC